MTTDDQKAQDKKQAAIEHQITLFKWAAWISVGLGSGAAWWGLRQIGHNSPNDLAALGSYLQGSVASVWSLAAFLFVYVAFLGQKQQLLLQRRELEEQRAQFQIQQQSIERQNFEISFFQLLNLQNQITSQVREKFSLAPDKPNAIGIDGLSALCQFLRNAYKANRDSKQGESTVAVRQSYLEFFRNLNGDLGHYFRNLYRLLDFIGKSGRNDSPRYFRIVTAQMSQYEFFLLFYHAFSPLGGDLKPLIEKFGLLHDMDLNWLLDLSHRGFYSGGYQLVE